MLEVIVVLDVTVIIGVEVNVDVLSVYDGVVNGDIVVGLIVDGVVNGDIVVGLIVDGVVNGDIVVGLIVDGVGVKVGDKILDGGGVVAFVFVTSYTAKPTTAAPINPKAIFLSMR
ncbi:MAG: hypothetical protein QXY20_09390 [Thermofilum sp.]|uniref:hypothetical protein n=1 Tax=Thermofilum sp. TaxID=1961369 RepID=UPI003164A438